VILIDKIRTIVKSKKALKKCKKFTKIEKVIFLEESNMANNWKPRSNEEEEGTYQKFLYNIKVSFVGHV